MIASLRKRVNGLKKDREHGAGWLTGQALEILREAASLDPATTMDKLIASLGGVTDALLEARPAMVSIANYALHFRDEVGAAALTSRSPQRLKKAAFSIADRLIKLHQKSAAAAARNASKLVTARSIVMTCSYSSAVCSALELAKRGGRDFKVLAVESRHKKISYGELTLQRLKQSGITGSTVPDSQIGWQAARADIMLCGADSVSLHGWLINGSPTLEMAQMAQRRGRPFYAVCDTSKFDARGLMAGLEQVEQGFDQVPLDLITGLVTEKGALQAEDVYKFTIEDLIGSTGERPR
jgi:translation initiation factor 2B subunit (eIF-2B alpha/beta/delta family)